MNETEATYRRLLQEREQKRLQDFMDTPEPIEGLPEEPEAPEVPKKTEKPSAVGAGVKRTMETGSQGITHFMRGVERVAQSTLDPNRSGVESLYGFGEVVLGGFTLAMAPWAGAGAAVRQAVENYVPGLEKSVAIPGNVAQFLRFGFGTPSILLDPEIHKVIRGDPDLTPAQRIEQREAFMAEFKKDMTYGELMEALAMFAAPGIALKAMKIRPRGGRPEPLQVQDAAGIKTTPQAATKKSAPPMAPEDVATRAEQIMKEMGDKTTDKGAGAKAPKKPKKGKTEGPAPEPKPFSEEEFAPYTQEWSDSLDQASKRAEAIILEEVAKDPELAKIIVAEAEKPGAATVEEAAGPLAAKLEDLTKLVAKEKQEPVARDKVIEQVEKDMPDATAEAKEAEINKRMGVPKGEVRALRPEAQGKRHPLEIAEDLTPEEFAAAELERQQKVAKLQKDAPYTVEEVAPDDPNFIPNIKSFVVDFGESALAPGRREQYVVSDKASAADIVKMRNEAIDIAAQAEEMRAGRQPTSRAKGRAEKSKSPKLGLHRSEGERGSIPAALLARMAVGAVIGGSQGNTPEEQVKYALLGMLGGAIAPRVAKRFVGMIRAENPRILDPNAPRVPSFARPDLTETTNHVIDRVAGDQRKLAEKVLSLEEGDAISLDELRLAKQVEMRSWEEVKRLADEIREGKPVPEGELREALAFSRMLNDQIHHSGRRLGATGTRGMERVKVAVGRVNQLAREWDPGTPESAIAEVLRASGSIEKVGAATRYYYAIPEALTQTMYGSMLLGKALVKNAVGNTAMVPISVIDRSLASLKYHDPKYTFGVAQQGVISLWEGIIDQMRMIKKWGALGEQAQSLGATHVELMPRGWEALSELQMEAGHPGIANGIDYINSISNLAPDIMSRTDGMAKAVHGRMATHWEAMEQARAEGLEMGDAYWNRVKELVDNYDQLGPEALLRIKEHRDHMTFTRQIESELLQALQAGPSDPWINLMYRMTLLPFVRTPVRLYDVGAEYTPGINFLSAQFRREMQAGGVRRTVAESRLATGTLAIGSFMYLAMQGYITGSMPSDPVEAKAMTDAGRPPQSVWDPLAQKYRSIKGIEPLTQWISTGADLAYLVGHLDEKSAEKLITAAGVAITNNINVTQFMQAMSEMVDVMKSGRTDSQWERSLEFIRRRLTVFVPAVAKELSGAGEEKTRALYSKEFDQDRSPHAAVHRELQALIDDYRKGFGAGPDARIKRVRNMFTGEPIINDVWPFNPFTTVPEQPAPWAKEISRLRGAGLRPLDEWMGRPQPADIGLQARPTAPGVRLEGPQLDRLEVLMTQVVKIGGKTLTESLDDLVTSPRYLKFPDFTRQDLIQERWGAFKELAERKLLSEDKNLRDSYMLRRGESIIEKLPTTRQPALRESIHRRFGPGVQP